MEGVVSGTPSHEYVFDSLITGVDIERLEADSPGELEWNGVGSDARRRGSAPTTLPLVCSLLAGHFGEIQEDLPRAGAFLSLHLVSSKHTLYELNLFFVLPQIIKDLSMASAVVRALRDCAGDEDSKVRRSSHQHVTSILAALTTSISGRCLLWRALGTSIMGWECLSV
jgi:hypothetical protein